MHKQNSDYGHRAILASAAQTFDERPIWGILQHGWTPLDGWTATVRLPARVPRFVWSSVAVARIPATRTKATYTPIGAPFCYALGARMGQGLWPEPGRRTVAFPIHSAETVSVTGSHERYAGDLLYRERGPIEVFLYWIDYQRTEIRRAYEAAGHRVHTLGATRRDRLFIPKFLRAMDGVGKVVSNRKSTAIMYAAALGLEASIYGTRMIAGDDGDRATICTPDDTTDSVSEDEALVELGMEDRLTPRQLREALGWTGWRNVSGGAVDTFLTARSAYRQRHLQGDYDAAVQSPELAYTPARPNGV